MPTHRLISRLASGFLLLTLLAASAPVRAQSSRTSKSDRENKVTAETGKLKVDVTLNGLQAPAATRLWVYSPGNTEDVITSGWPDTPLELKAGHYDVVAEYPVNALAPIQVRREKVEVLAGETRRIQINAVQKVGWLKADVLSNGERVLAASLFILPNRQRGGDSGPLSHGVAASLPPGKYTVASILESTAGPISAYVDDVEVKADELSETIVDLGPTGLLEVRVKGGEPQNGVFAGLVPKGQTYPSGLLPAFASDRIRAGSYDLLMQSRGPLPLFWWHRDVEVRPGETTVVEVEGPPVKLP